MRKYYLFIVIGVIALVLAGLYFFQKSGLNNEPVTTSAPKITYIKSNSNMINVELPFPGAVVGKNFSVIGKARGTWFFEASFPVKIVGKNGEILAHQPAQAQGEWMTPDFVPFRTDIKIRETYIGPATIILEKDNASGLPEHDASMSFDFIIEY